MEEGSNLQVMCRGIVKPFQKDHPKTLKLSYLDQLSSPPGLYIPIIFFFYHAQTSQKLKRSLSLTLATFYPLAGRANGDDNTSVDCNDAGVEFIEARAHVRLADALMEGEQYAPIDVANSPTFGVGEKPLLVIQVTFFDCGGMALGICYSHMLADAHSIMMFINAWAYACRFDTQNKNENERMVSFDLANHFPAREFPGPRPDPVNEKITRSKMKMLVFDKEKIALLKKEAVSSTVKDPTRVEVISAFIWKFMRATIEAKTVFAMHAVNLRGRKRLLENVFGNCFMVSSAVAGDEGDVEFRALVNELRRSISKIDDDYITKSQNGDNYVNDSAQLCCEGEMEVCGFSSWCRFPFYEVDYGSGTPVLFYPVVAAMKNVFILVSSKNGEDIQAWVSMEQHNLQMLQKQIDLISTTTTTTII